MGSRDHAPTYTPDPRYSREDWDEVDSPELTDEQLAAGQPLRDVMPDLVDAIRRRRGPQKAPTKEQIAIRIDQDVLERFRAGGAGWQGRINATLRRALGI